MDVLDKDIDDKSLGYDERMKLWRSQDFKYLLKNYMKRAYNKES